MKQTTRKKMKLGDVATYINGYAFKPKDRGEIGLPIIRIQDLTGNAYDLGFYDGEYPEKIEINYGDILISWSASLGVYIWNRGKALLNQHIFKVVFDKVDIDKKYFVYAVQKKLDEMKMKTHGATMKHIVKKDFDAILIPYPSLNEQMEIANNLDKVSRVIVAYKKELQLLDNLVKARFVEMFGDVKDNPHNYEIFLIKTLLKSCETGWSANGTQREKKDNEIAVLKVSSVTKGYFIPEECKVLDDQANIKKYVTPEKGDLIFSRANTREMVGATAVIMEDYPLLILPDKLWKIKFKSSVNVFYMKYVLSSKSIRNEFSAASTGTSGSMYNVSMDKFKSIKIPVAPIELQNQFADFVRAVDKSKVAVQKALDEAQLLFDSLMQEYFG
ncbi:restriction endonuclease subunit S [Anaerobutyricum hallii]|uniref:restriction endonuclease subunit S n=1 Tax=Anaerobutyricum hallii TaxID=39488 RepID=UPI0039953E39